MAPKRKGSDADNSDMPKRQVLPLTERVKVVDLRKEKKKFYAEVDRIFSPWNCEDGKKKIASFAIVPQIAKVMGAVHNKCLINKEKAWDVPGSPVVKTLHFQCKEHGFDPLSGT